MHAHVICTSKMIVYYKLEALKLKGVQLRSDQKSVAVNRPSPRGKPKYKDYIGLSTIYTAS